MIDFLPDLLLPDFPGLQLDVEKRVRRDDHLAAQVIELEPVVRLVTPLMGRMVRLPVTARG